MTDDALFTKVSDAQRRTVLSAKGPNGMYLPVIAALGDGSMLRVRIKSTSIGQLGRDVMRAYPDKRLASRKTDDPAFRYLWLVAR